MSKVAVGLLVSTVLAGNVVTVALLLGERGAGGVTARDDGKPALAPLLEAIDALRADVDRLAARAAPSAPSTGVDRAGSADEGAAPAAPADAALAARFDEVVERLERLDKTLGAMKDVEAELAAAELREKRQERFRAEDGYMLADELLAEKQFAVGANGILSFLEAHPDHPDARDLLRKARDAFLQAGYGEKALWLHGEIMKRYPEHRGQDLYSLAMLERKLKKYDEALGHIEESVELARTDQDRLNRLFYRAYLIHQRDGDAAGLDAYREVERQSTAAGIDVPGKEAGNRAGEIEARLASR